MTQHPTRSQAQHRIVTERYLPAQMRDGLRLYADVHRPEADGPWPVILMRVPYDKTAATPLHYVDYFVPRRYIVVVRPDGYAHNLADGMIRARYRESRANPSPIAPGMVYEYTLDLWSTSMVCQPGHRLRVEITGAKFPRFDRNPNTGHLLFRDAELRAATQTILHDAAHPSHIVLPVIPR
jgi:predicted acyl esterase